MHFVCVCHYHCAGSCSFFSGKTFDLVSMKPISIGREEQTDEGWFFYIHEFLTNFPAFMFLIIDFGNNNKIITNGLYSVPILVCVCGP